MRRSSEIWLVAYYLSKCSQPNDGRTSSPPNELRVADWNHAYAMFYRNLGEGRPLSTFANSLKNARDMFDPHLQSSRVGWREQGDHQSPAELPAEAKRVLKSWAKRSDSALATEVMRLADLGVAQVPGDILSDLFAEMDPSGKQREIRTEGGRRAVIINRIERDPSLRNAALRLHGFACQVCGFKFEEAYGPWGSGFAVVHHLKMLAADKAKMRETDPKLDLAVLCANCHCMVHRKRDTVLTLEELSAKMRHPRCTDQTRGASSRNARY